MFQLRSALGDAYSEQVACLNKANASPQVVAMDQLVKKLNGEWRPTGYYTPDDLQKIIAVLDDAAERVGAVIGRAPDPWFSPDSARMKREAIEDIKRKWADRGSYFREELSKARAAGARVIDAPGVKDWVVSSLRAMSDGYTTAAMLGCQTSFFQVTLLGAFNAIAEVGRVVWGIGGAVVEVGEQMWKATKDAGRVVAFIARLAPFALVGLGSYLAFVFGRASYQRLVKRVEQPINWSIFRRKPKQISGRRR